MTHLILKDMVKVKGQVSEMAVLLIDPEEAIVGVAQNFFNELSNKASGCSGFLVHLSSSGADKGWIDDTRIWSPGEGVLLLGIYLLFLCVA